ncbi:MAG: hypothetical protein DWQ44_00785 [Bacteroidetes bacterium]|nr:MAG: hypothetical protein DWQ33_00255 [Bacteroidota bacterium]REK05040.1 MAG: hypothetical protein DWQ39_07465 [Bacteroidota bacterium]REK36457.1 MAG: hypothetical protein DWQ44_00785 [Bacteroidota bacterium]REK51671.1 MAG: hypothetical protein DWQ48_00535 [Bacteroidota bacterium]
MKLIQSFGLLIVFAFIIWSCKKDETKLEFDIQAAQDHALAEGIFNDVMSISNLAIENGEPGVQSAYRSGEGSNLLASNCARVSITPDSSGQGGFIVVDFGSQNCKGSDNRYRRGIINISYTGFYRDSGTVITSTMQDYYVGIDSTNMYKVNGTKTLKNEGRNSSNNIWFSISVNSQITNKGNSVLTWNSTRQREWIAGSTTTGWLMWLDDVYSITGSASGTSFEGKNFTVNITKALKVALNCKWITEGTLELTPEGLTPRVLDYGSGTCDNDARITVGGASFDVKLR